jgi:hypothetical protein
MIGSEASLSLNVSCGAKRGQAVRLSSYAGRRIRTIGMQVRVQG